MLFETLHTPEQIYLDHNATTPVSVVVRDRILEWVEAWGNPSSIHRAGRKPKTLMREARALIAKMLGVDALELIFTSGGSEANNLAIKGIFNSLKNPANSRHGRNHYLFSSVEHPSLMRSAEYLTAQGARVDFIPVNRDGLIDVEFVKAHVSPETALVSVMFANNETGSIFPIKELVAIAHQHGALFHSDCVQVLGKMPLNLRELDVDLASVSGHKFYSLRGCGVLFSKRGTEIESLIHGGGQERHRRGGTENVLAIAALGEMSKLANEVETRYAVMRDLRNEMEALLKSNISGLSVTAERSKRLPGTSSMVIPGVDGETLLMNLDLRGFAVSTGAACSSGNPEPSPVLLAMGLTRDEAQASLRVGLGWGTNREHIEKFVTTLQDVVVHLRGLEGSSWKI